MPKIYYYNTFTYRRPTRVLYHPKGRLVLHPTKVSISSNTSARTSQKAVCVQHTQHPRPGFPPPLPIKKYKTLWKAVLYVIFYFTDISSKSNFSNSSEALSLSTNRLSLSIQLTKRFKLQYLKFKADSCVKLIKILATFDGRILLPDAILFYGSYETRNSGMTEHKQRPTRLRHLATTTKPNHYS